MSFRKLIGKENDPNKQRFYPKGKKKDFEDGEIKELQGRYNQVVIEDVKTFDDIPLTVRTRKGLSENNYNVPTEIQRESILLALQGHDILGAAKTGSGKTLAFLIPTLEILYCKKWTSLDGVGAIIITPTRELAMQIYETLVKVGKHHEFSAGLIIGGKDWKFERRRMAQVNIIICTPGRLLQHMNETAFFDCSNLQLLVLDEADRCLDMGFKQEMDYIIENLPSGRQTLLFSATQTKKVKDLSRLSLVDPKYVSVHENEKHKTPDGLKQSYILCPHHEKISVLWSFIKNHPKHKIIVFMSTRKQVRYLYEAFRKLRPSNPIFALQGRFSQEKRMDMYHAFCRKEHAVLFGTDIAARGLDFPEVHWVLQLDCPMDVESYIHRVGRTARYYRGGESLLLLDPSEVVFLEKLASAKIPISEIRVNQQCIISPQNKLEVLLTKFGDLLKSAATKAFSAYVKSVSVMKDKTVFDVRSIDKYLYARSLGLINIPGEKEEMDKKDEEYERKRSERSLENGKTFSDKDDESGFLVLVKPHNPRQVTESEQPEPTNENTTFSKQDIRRMMRKNILPNKKVVFCDEEQKEYEEGYKEATLNIDSDKVSTQGIDFISEFEKLTTGYERIEFSQKWINERDRIDKKLYSEMKRAQKLMEKLRRNEATEKEAEGGDEEDGESSEEEGPDLSWLPDPDRVYSKEQEEESPEEQEDNDIDAGIKRKLPSDFEDDEEDDTLGLSLKEKEQLALNLLS